MATLRKRARASGSKLGGLLNEKGSALFKMVM